MNLFKTLIAIMIEILQYASIIYQLAKDLAHAWLLQLRDTLRSKKSVKGQVVVITGGAGGIGRAVGKMMAKLDAKVVLLDLHEDALEKAAAEINEEGAWPAKTFRCDCTKDREMKFIAERIKNDPDLGPVDILICCAGYMYAKPILDMDYEGVTKSFDVNVISYFWAIQSFLPHMLEKNLGQVVAISSIAGHFGQTYSAAYSASKFAIRGLIESLKWELFDINMTGIKTTMIYPYFTQTQLISDISPSSRFFNNLPIDYTASCIVSDILYEKEETFIPSFMSLFCLLIKETSPSRVKAVWRTFFNVVYYTEGHANKMPTIPLSGKIVDSRRSPSPVERIKSLTLNKSQTVASAAATGGTVNGTTDKESPSKSDATPVRNGLGNADAESKENGVYENGLHNASAVMEEILRAETPKSRSSRSPNSPFSSPESPRSSGKVVESDDSMTTAAS